MVRSAGTPQSGDVIFFYTSKDAFYHVGIVDYVANGRVYTIEGNATDAVRSRSYSLTDSRIHGYGRNGDVIDKPNTSDKRERMVIMGAEGIRRYPNFIECSIKRIKEVKIKYPNDTISWLVANTPDFNQHEIQAIKASARTLNCKLVFFSSSKNLINHINEAEFKIGSIYVYAHGNAGNLLFGYISGSGNLIISNISFNMSINEIDKINSKSFANDAITEFYTCATADPNIDFSKKWYECNLGKTKAALKKTEYSYIIGKTEAEINKHLEYRDKGLLFNPEGALYYPELATENGPNRWVYYPK